MTDRTTGARGLIAWLTLAGAALGCSGDASATEPVDAVGRRVYEQGWRVDARPWRGQGIGGLSVDSTCASCHRRSGMGGPEGDRRVPAITAVDLFSGPDSRPRNGPGDLQTRGARPGKAVVPSRREARETYTDATLARAIRSGVDASGRPLGPLMPRYPDLDDATLAALIAHLRTLQATPPPGRVDGVLHLATIVTPDAPPTRVRALTDVLERWVARRAGLQLHTWTLSGPPEQWQAQLTARQQAEPVWAVLSGAGASAWDGVQAFCEAQALPCVLPLLDTLPADAATSHWSLHFSPGIELEASALAQHLRGDGASSRGRIVQWTQPGLGARAAETFERAWAGANSGAHSGMTPSVTRTVQPADAADLAAAWAALRPDDTLLLWLDPAALQAVWRLAPPDAARPAQLFLSATLAGHDTRPPAPLRAIARLVGDELDARGTQGRTALGLQPWARHVGLVLDPAGGDSRERAHEQARAYAAAGYFGDAVARLRGRLDREFLLETLERAVDNRPFAGPYASLSLGPDQRIASKSALLWRWVEAGPGAASQASADGTSDGGRWTALPERITP